MISNQLDAQILSNVFIYLFITLHMFRARRAHHLEEANCTNTASVNCHSMLVTVSCAGPNQHWKEFVRQVGYLPRITEWCTVNKTLNYYYYCYYCHHILQYIYSYIRETNHIFYSIKCCSCSVFTVCATRNVISPVKYVFYFDISTSRSLCTVYKGKKR